MIKLDKDSSNINVNINIEINKLSFKKVKAMYNDNPFSITLFFILIFLVSFFVCLFTYAILLITFGLLFCITGTIGADFPTISMSLFKTIFAHIDSVEAMFYINDNHIFFNKVLNYIPMFFSTLSMIAITKTLLTKKCCILNGLKLTNVIKLNLEIAALFLIPYYFNIYIHLFILCLSIAGIYILLKHLYNLLLSIYDIIINMFSKVNDKYNEVCNKQEE